MRWMTGEVEELECETVVTTLKRNAGGVAGPALATTSSKYRGVYWHKKRRKWQVQFTVHGKNKHFGYFNDEVEAARAYDDEARKHGKPLNFDTTAELSAVPPPQRYRCA